MEVKPAMWAFVAKPNRKATKTGFCCTDCLDQYVFLLLLQLKHCSVHATAWDPQSQLDKSIFTAQAENKTDSTDTEKKT